MRHRRNPEHLFTRAFLALIVVLVFTLGHPGIAMLFLLTLVLW